MESAWGVGELVGASVFWISVAVAVLCSKGMAVELVVEQANTIKKMMLGAIVYFCKSCFFIKTPGIE